MSTIKDVAQHTGLSIATISKYLNGGNVLEENRILIAEAIKKLNYSVNYAARALKTNKTMTVGALLPSLNTPFFSKICEKIEALLKVAGYSLILCSYYGDPIEEVNKLRFLINQNVDGIILVPEFIEGSDILSINEIAEKKMPLVLLDRTVNGIECDRVLADNAIAIYTAVEQFIIKGHRRIGIIIGPEEISTAAERKTGYLRALDDYEVDVDFDLIRNGDYTYGSGYRSMTDLFDLADAPTAIIGTNHEMTMGAITATFERKLKIPEDISFIGYDEEYLTRIIDPPITTVMQPHDELAKNVADILLLRMAGDYSSFPQVLRLKTQMELHDSIRKVN